MRLLRAPRTLAGAAALGLALCLAASAGATPVVDTAAAPVLVPPAAAPVMVPPAPRSSSALEGMKPSRLAASVPSKGGATIRATGHRLTDRPHDRR